MWMLRCPHSHELLALLTVYVDDLLLSADEEISLGGNPSHLEDQHAGVRHREGRLEVLRFRSASGLRGLVDLSEEFHSGSFGEVPRGHGKGHHSLRQGGRNVGTASIH